MFKVERYLRQLAGIVLKNHVRKCYGSTQPPVKQYVKQMVVRALGDEFVPLRRTVGIIITTIIGKEEGFSRWPGLLEGLVGSLQQGERPGLRDGALYAVEFLCEDSTRELEDHPARPLNTLVPILIQLVREHPGNVRLRCLKSLNYFLVDFPNALKVNATPFLEAVFASANDKDGSVTREVCRTFCTMVDIKPDYIAPYLGSVLSFMMVQLGSQNEETRTEAADFWAAAVEQPAMQLQVKQHVPQLLPVLLENMVYSEDEVEGLMERDDATKPLSDRDVAPFFAKARKKGSVGDEGDGGAAEGDSDPSLQWTPRKASAAALDAMCQVFQDQILGVLMPLLVKRLQHENWRWREAAVLALGAAADGTINGMVPMLPQLASSLLSIIGNPQSPALLTAISCWSLSRLFSWVVRSSAAGTENAYIPAVVRQLLTLMASPSRRVQEASSSALAVLAEETWAVSKRNARHNILLAPHCGAILQQMVGVVPRYQAKALLIWYDTLHTILEHLPENPDVQRGVATVVLPPLMKMWTHSQDTDRRIIPLMGALGSVALAGGATLAPYAGPVLQRSLHMAALHMQTYGTYSQQLKQLETDVRAHRPEVTPTELRDFLAQKLGADLPYDLDFVIAAIDLVSAVCEALGNACMQLLQPIQQPLVKLLGDCMSCADVGVKQAVFALVGDLCRSAFDIIAPAAFATVPLLVDNLYGSYTDLCVNASWALGELSDRLGPRLAPHAPEAINRIVRVLRSHHDPMLLRNLSITLARLAMHNPQLVAQRLEDVAPHWLTPLCQIKFGSERDRTHIAALSVLAGNPQVALQQLPRVATLIHSWGDTPPPPLVKKAWSDLVGLLSRSPQWGTHWALVPPDVQQYCQNVTK